MRLENKSFVGRALTDATRFTRHVLVFTGLFIGGSMGVAHAQQKYTPDDPYVEGLVRAAVAYLENNRPRSADEQTLAAIAVVETYKRYEDEIPSDHPIVSDAIEQILADVVAHQNSPRNPLGTGGIYYPSLAAILLCEVNDQKYAEQIKLILGLIETRQHPNGGYGYDHEPDIEDTSQGQYAGLALVVARNHGFHLPPDISSQLLDFYCNHQSENTWIYHYKNGVLEGRDNLKRLSLHISALSSTFLLADVLRLRTKPKRIAGGPVKNLDGTLPPSVVLYVKPKSGEADNQDDANRPLIAFDVAKLNNVQTSGTRHLRDQYQVFPPRWPYYYLYGFERYAFFREKAEGTLSEFPSWYDDGVDYLASIQGQDGSWRGQVERLQDESVTAATGLAILFLVRSSQLLMVEGGSGEMLGGQGFPSNRILEMRKGDLVADDLGKGIEDVVKLIREADSEDQLELILPILGPAIKQLSEDTTKSRGEKMAFLRSLVMHEEMMRRLVAVKILASQQDLDSVPALLFALTDPAVDVCIEAHNGLRLISRKIDAFPLSSDPQPPELAEVKQRWTEWFLRIRPDAVLMD
jgi:hypothetical protein